MFDFRTRHNILCGHTSFGFSGKMMSYILVLSAFIILTQATVKFEIINEEIGMIWVGIKPEPGKTVVENGGFELHVTETKTINVPDNWSGKLWARTWCDPVSKHCLTGDCGNKLECDGNGGSPPVTIVDISLKGDRGLDYYDVSLVDGFNLGASIQPVAGIGDGSNSSCKPASCLHEFRRDCPTELMSLNSAYGVLGCNNPCHTFNTDEYCCREAYSTASTCVSDVWVKDYSAIFRKGCPDAFNYAYDKNGKTFTCKAEHYTISFGIRF